MTDFSYNEYVTVLKDLGDEVLFNDLKNSVVNNLSFYQVYNNSNNKSILFNRFLEIINFYDHTSYWKNISEKALEKLSDNIKYKIIKIYISSVPENLAEFIEKCILKEGKIEIDKKNLAEKIKLKIPNNYNLENTLYIDLSDIKTIICVLKEHSLIGGYLIEYNHLIKDYSANKKINQLDNLITEIYLKEIGEIKWN